MHTLEEKKEHVVMHYKNCFDVDIAMLKAGVTEEEKQLLKRDESFMYRISFADAIIREQILGVMLDNLKSGDERVAHKAAVDLGNILWGEKFKPKESDKDNGMVPDTIILVGKRPEGTK